MHIDEIRALFTKQRQEIAYPHEIREVTAHTVRSYIPHERGAVFYSDLNAQNADAFITDEIARFNELGLTHDFEWKLYDYDQPPDLKARLEAQGFVGEEEEAILVLDLDHTPPRLLESPRNDVRQVRDADEIDHIVSIRENVWSEKSTPWSGTHLRRALADGTNTISIYIAYVDGIPASAAWIDFDPSGKSQFAGLWGGSTLPAYRQRGLYTDLVAVRAQEARQRGIKFLTIDASPMSRAVLEKFGFQLMAISTPMNYNDKT